MNVGLVEWGEVVVGKSQIQQEARSWGPEGSQLLVFNTILLLESPCLLVGSLVRNKISAAL